MFLAFHEPVKFFKNMKFSFKGEACNPFSQKQTTQKYTVQSMWCSYDQTFLHCITEICNRESLRDFSEWDASN